MNAMFLILGVAVAAGLFGLWRGVRAEAITLCGVVAGAQLFGPDTHVEQVLSVVGRFPAVVRALIDRKGFLAVSTVKDGPELGEGQQLILSIIFFAGIVVISYLLGSYLGGPALSRLHSGFGLIMGIASGALTSRTLVEDVGAYSPGSPVWRCSRPLH